jgi:hypothetical protein
VVGGGGLAEGEARAAAELQGRGRPVAARGAARLGDCVVPSWGTAAVPPAGLGVAGAAWLPLLVPAGCGSSLWLTPCASAVAHPAAAASAQRLRGGDRERGESGSQLRVCGLLGFWWSVGLGPNMCSVLSAMDCFLSSLRLTGNRTKITEAFRFL